MPISPKTDRLKIEIWEQLRTRPYQWLSVSNLASHLELTSQDLNLSVAELINFGFGIEIHPQFGIRYIHPARRLCPEQIQWQLNTRIVGNSLQVHNRVSSTNDLALQFAQTESANGTVFLAEEQTKGRGRRGREWFAPASSSLLMSLVLSLPKPHNDPAFLTALAAVAIGQVIEPLCVAPVCIKWPNDLYVSEKKIAGILVEKSNKASVIGVGLNVFISTTEFPPELRSHATSLQSESRYPIDRSELAKQIILAFDRLLHQSASSGTESLWQWWQMKSGYKGQHVLVSMPDKTLKGKVLDLHPQNGLVLENDDGTKIQILSHRIQRIERVS